MTSFPEIHLDAVLSGDSTAVAQLVSSLRADGFCFVRLPKALVEMVKVFHGRLAHFLVEGDQKSKRTLSKDFLDGGALEGLVYGYNATEDFKEGFRWLTGAKMDQNLVPATLRGQPMDLIGHLHEILLKIIALTSEPLFQTGYATFQKTIPLVRSSAEAFGIVDFVCYNDSRKNPLTQRTQTTNDEDMEVEENVEISVAEHYDPGLLSLNVLNTQRGLQFRDKDGIFHDVPTDPEIGTIWTGEYANISNPNVQKGWHRVVRHPESPKRVSLWIEACTKYQDFSDPQVLSLFRPQERRGMDVLPVLQGETLGEALSLASRKFGYPMTKTITYYCPLCVQPVRSLEPHFDEAHKNQVIRYDFYRDQIKQKSESNTTQVGCSVH
eukprot:TRINITY_DN1314_c0_g1_i2.p1 TRINITY_DN1314_c0_g1~~TRINITY_DN1314_c0_g1_i2.p1  ORF type:complete len:381 (-),score=43.36 TRINITY_DN1314_c0_g1_i2:488-1630(-)